VGGGDTHTKGGSKTPNAWFFGMVPRRNPEMAIVVLQEHGDWGSGSAMIAQRVVIAYVNKQRRLEKDVLQQAGASNPVEVGAVWTDPQPSARSAAGSQRASLHAGHFFVDPNSQTGPMAAAPRALASGTPALLPEWLSESLLRFKEDLP
jgi:penicillin-binding protein 2